MNIPVEYRDGNGKINNLNYDISLPAFIKHLAFAGMGYFPSLHKIMRTIGMYFHYHPFIHQVWHNHFSPHHPSLSDPTERNHFSNLLGKAIADFLAKRIHKANLTFNYETVMKEENCLIKGRRPDLIAFINQNQRFAIESKARIKSNSGNMQNYKIQAKSGPLKVDFAVACVSYNIYNQMECKYYDPPMEWNNNTNYYSFGELTKKYYSGLLEFLELPYKTKTYYNEEFYEVNLTDHLRELYFNCFCPCLFRYDCKILLSTNIETWAAEGMKKNILPFEHKLAENIYIDNDRVGLILERN